MKTNNMIYMLILLNLTFPPYSFAFESIKVLPMLIGYSFSEYEPYIFSQSEDTCADSANIQLIFPVDFESENEFPEEFNSKLPSCPDGKWDIKFSSKRISDSVTTNYNSSQTKNALIGEATCSSNKIFQHVEYIAHPVYICPENSLFHHEGCFSIDLEHCSGDVIGRDLNSSFSIIQEQGHIGIPFRQRVIEDEISVGETLPTYVLEVLNNENVFNFNILKDFENEVPNGYWGEKYGTKTNPTIKAEDLDKIWNAFYQLGEQFDKGARIEYAYSWHISTGETYRAYEYDQISQTFIKKKFQRPISFRCDTFVKYLFEQGPGVKFDIETFITPRTLYNSLLNLRNGQDLLKSAIFSSHKITKSPDELEKDIQVAFDTSAPLDTLDQLTYTYTKDNSIDNQRKASFYLSLINANSNNDDKILYILDLFTDLKFFTSSLDLIDIYNNSDNEYIQYKIYGILSQAILFQNEADIKNLSQSDINLIISVQDFLELNSPITLLNSKFHQKSFNKLRQLISGFHKTKWGYSNLNSDWDKRSQTQ